MGLALLKTDKLLPMLSYQMSYKPVYLLRLSTSSESWLIPLRFSRLLHWSCSKCSQGI
jgi:hypothetical protein